MCYQLVLLLHIVHILVDSHSVVEALVLRVIHQIHLFIVVVVEMVVPVLKTLVNAVAINIVLIAKAFLIMYHVSPCIHLVFFFLARLDQLFIVHVGGSNGLLGLGLAHAFPNNLFFYVAASAPQEIDEVVVISACCARRRGYRACPHCILLHGIALLLIMSNIVVKVLDGNVVALL